MGFWIILVVWVLLAGVSIYGWILNVIAVVHAIDLPITGMFILRCIGILAAPLGIVLGLFF